MDTKQDTPAATVRKGHRAAKTLKRPARAVRPGCLPPGQLPLKETTPLDPSLVKRITAKIRGKPVLAREIAPGQGTEIYKVLLAMSEEHGRTLVVTCHMRDGSKQRYRGNGNRLGARAASAPSIPHREAQAKVEPVAEPAPEPWRPYEVS